MRTQLTMCCCRSLLISIYECRNCDRILERCVFFCINYKHLLVIAVIWVKRMHKLERQTPPVLWWNICRAGACLPLQLMHTLPHLWLVTASSPSKRLSDSPVSIYTIEMNTHTQLENLITIIVVIKCLRFQADLKAESSLLLLYICLLLMAI